ncbi:MAG: Asp-tRNA(Asn)/Glu-tRNA(Gln) amidotransferase subunit GatA [Trueperaceae bacterium]|nr:MAG: Asp-tRNA(Asn)/Glu-tRNA(Gln) amidotransferase subunit GatA [Trueperaceae bacterium]
MMTAVEIGRQVASGRVRAQEIVRAALERAELTQVELNAFITIAHESALEQAEKIDERLAAGEDVGPLAGVPIVVKDNICTEGLRSTAASESLASFVPPYSATVVERLEQAGAVVVAKANLDEFGMGSSNENSAFGAVKNPWDTSRVPGGSSGGSAVAVATGVVPIALGTDTGGSVRQPGSFTGVIGFKPTYGRLSRYGVIAYASSLDQVGVLCRSAEDLALSMDVMAGHDPKDATSLAGVAPAFAKAVTGASDLTGVRVGLIEELTGEGNSAGVMAALELTCERLVQLGAELQQVSVPTARDGIPAYYLVAMAEASSNLARYDGMVYSSRTGEDRLGQADVMMKSRGSSLGPEVRRRILMGTYALSAGYYDAYYGKALKVRRLIAHEIERAFEEVDLLLTPTVPSVAYPLGEKVDDPLAMYLGDIDTCLANLVGIAAISVPAGFTAERLPCGVQFMAPALQDERLVGVTALLERHVGEKFAPLAPL